MNRLLVILVVLVAALGLGAYIYQRQQQPPDISSPLYHNTVTAFYVGLAALDSGDNPRAEASMKQATQLVPAEPAVWADLGLIQIRKGDFDAAAQSLTKAQELAPANADIEKLWGLLQDQQGKPDEAITHWKRAITLNPRDLKARYALAQELERQGGQNIEQQEQQLFDEILKAQPNNIVALLEKARLAGRSGDADTLRTTVQQIAKYGSGWPPSAQEQLQELQKALSNPRMAATNVQFLKNVLSPVPTYQQSLEALAVPAGQAGEPLLRFLSMPSPSPLPAEPDLGVTFTTEQLAPQRTKASAIGTPYAIWLTSQGKGSICNVSTGPKGESQLTAMASIFEKGPGLFVANAHAVQQVGVPAVTLLFPGGPSAIAPSPHGVLGLDWNYDFMTDLFLAGAGGIKFYQQTQPGKFSDVTARTKLPPNILTGNYYGAWAADIEADGDVDIVLAPTTGAPLVLRNNGDGTFAVLRPFSGMPSLRAFVWGDFDHDGDPDAAMVDEAGTLHYFTNNRSGQFRPRELPTNLGKVLAVTAADVNNDGILDLVVVQANGTVLRVSDKDDGQGWDTAPIATWSGAAASKGAAHIFVEDLDNNGSPDLVVSGGGQSQVWLSDAAGKFAPLGTPLQAEVLAVTDLNADGRLDFVGLNASHQPVRLLNKGAKSYGWQSLWPEGCEHADKEGDKRINSYGIGGELEVRAGLLVQKMPINGPVVHFGLGNQKSVDVVRIVWPNGAPQAEFDVATNQALLAKQRLTGSCPFLFAWNGKRMSFVKDCNWRSPLGLKINAQDTAGVVQTEDWVKVRRDQLVPKDGYYDLRVTADLWEAHFFDYLSLMAVDHPVGTDIWVDERFSVPMPPLQVIATAPSHPVTRAWDDNGQDVTDIIKAEDGHYLDTFGRGEYQGVTRDHYVEVELGQEVPRNGHLWLVAKGWLHPTDSSINVALGQGHGPIPHGLSLEVADGKGGWKVARPLLGFPAGKLKTILVNLDGVFMPGAARKFRLRTNLEIYWDQLSWATGLPKTTLAQQRLMPQVANLRYRGFTELHAKNRSAPELPESYDEIVQTSQRWRDLIGYYTRFGDVRELLNKVDDRYVIMNAGDEMVLHFPVPPPPPAGWVRDFVFITDGWTKDGNMNTGFSKTLLPLPAHDITGYSRPPGRLEDDPVYRRHPQDWQQYQTRYVAPREFQHVLRHALTG
ncbi:MAG: VCBS repeat-containing protein [Abitibacteriaceae bacterium]|nr:VCBS repeat-containing protein [Abditibacteriaceae bacterium]